MICARWLEICGVIRGNYRNDDGLPMWESDMFAYLAVCSEYGLKHQPIPLGICTNWEPADVPDAPIIHYCQPIIGKDGSKIVNRFRERGEVAVVSGFQGIHEQTGRLTTLGRGGSDTTAVALAAALDADICEIYTDVDGVFTADPRAVPLARKLARITSEEMLELAAGGAKVLYIRAVEYARRHGVTLHVRSSFNNNEGTIVYNSETADPNGDTVEEPIIAGIAADLSEAKITVVGVPDIPGKAAQIFKIVASANANVDMIVQNVSGAATGVTDISFTLPKSEGQATLTALTNEQENVGFASLQYDDQIGKLTLVGGGMRTNTGVSAKLFEALYLAGINIEMISTSEIRISVVTRADTIKEALRVVHTAFNLDSEDEAVVHGGTGR
jgi:aspartate kinase